MRFLGLFVLSILFVVAGCESNGKVKEFDWGPAYEDIAVPEVFEPLRTKPFKRNKRIFGKYFYRSSKGLERPNKISAWFSKELPKQGWELQGNDSNDAKGLMTLRFIKGDDRLTINMNPDERMSANQRYSVLTIEINSQYE